MLLIICAAVGYFLAGGIGLLLGVIIAIMLYG